MRRVVVWWCPGCGELAVTQGRAPRACRRCGGDRWFEVAQVDGRGAVRVSRGGVAG